MRIISVANQKGGCGKTTTAVNLSASLAANSKKVLLIDLDPQAHATLGLNIDSELNTYHVLSKLTTRKAALKDIIQNLGQNFDIAPSNIILSTLEQELAGEIGRESRLNDVLQEFNAQSNYDYIIIDCPPNLGILTINALRAANELIIPVEASRFSLEGLSQLISIINLVRDRLSHDVDFKVLVTNFDSRLQHSFTMLARIKADFQNKLFGTIIHVNVKLREAQNEGTHVFNYDKYCRGAKDYFSLSREIITQEKGVVQAEAAPAQKEAAAPDLGQRMKEILKEEMPRLTEVAFSVNAPDAKEVFLVGEFNSWKMDDSSRMEQVQDGAWQKKVDLSAGKYRYLFVIDGHWAEDAGNPLKEESPYGSMNSLLDIA